MKKIMNIENEIIPSFSNNIALINNFLPQANSISIESPIDDADSNRPLRKDDKNPNDEIQVQNSVAKQEIINHKQIPELNKDNNDNDYKKQYYTSLKMLKIDPDKLKVFLSFKRS